MSPSSTWCLQSAWSLNYRLYHCVYILILQKICVRCIEHTTFHSAFYKDTIRYFFCKFMCTKLYIKKWFFNITKGKHYVTGLVQCFKVSSNSKNEDIVQILTKTKNPPTLTFHLSAAVDIEIKWGVQYVNNMP